MQAKQAQATSGLQSQAAAMAGTAQSAKQLQFALRGVPAQMTDIATSLASGQRPLQVLLQQGGQLKDMFGGIGPAARALGGYIVGLVNPLTIGAAAIAGIAFAAHAGSEELRSFQNAATLSGNAIGVSASRFGELRDSLASVAGTKGKAAEVLAEIAKNGQLAGQNISAIAEAAVLMEKATGQAVSKTLADFVKLQDEPAKAAAELNKQYNFLSTAIYAQIKALEEQGEKQKAADLATKQLADTTKDRSKAIVENVGYIEAAWKGVLGVLKEVGDKTLEIGRQQSTAQELAGVQAELKSVRGQDPNRRFRLPWQKSEQELAADERRLLRMLEIQNGSAAAAEQAAAATRAGIAAYDAASKTSEQYADKQAKLNKALKEYRDSLAELRKTPADERTAAIRAQLDPKTIARTEAGIRKSFAPETTGQSEVAGIRARVESEQRELKRLQDQIASGNFSDRKLSAGEELVIKIQEELKTSITGVARAEKERALAAAQSLAVVQRQREAQEEQNKAYKDALATITKHADAVGQQADAIRQQAIGQEAANAQFGKSKTAVEESTLALLKLQLAEADSSDTFDPRYVAGLRAKTEAQERFVAALQKAEFLQKSRSLDEAGRVAAEETQTLQLEVSLLGRTQQEREKIIAQRRVEVALAKELAEIERLNLGTGPEADAKRRELQDKARSNARVQAANAEQKTILDEWQRTTDSINQSLTDALLRGFESGKDFAQNLRDTLKNMFATLVLKPVIQAVLQPVAGQLASFGQQGFGSLFGQPGNLMGPPSPFGGSMSIPGLGTIAGSQLGFLGTIAAGGAMVGSTIGQMMGLKGDQMKVASAGGALFGGIPGAIFGKLVSPGGGPKTESGFGVGMPTRGDPTAARTIVEATQATYKAIAGQLAKDLQLGVFSAADPQGTAQTQLAFDAFLNGQKISSRGDRLGGTENVGRSEAELTAAVTDEANRVILKALEETGLPDKIGAYLRQLGDVDALSGGALDAAVQKLKKAMTERQTLEAQLFDLTHTDLEQVAAARAKEREAIDDTNRALYDHIAALSDLKATEAAARGALMAAYERESDALRGVVERHTNYAQQLRQVRDSLADEAPASRSTRTARANSVFSGTLSSAVAGNEQALQALGASGKALIDAARESARTPAEVAAAVARVQAGLTTAASSAEGRATTAQQQLDAMTQQLTALGLLNTTVISVGDALTAFLNAQTAIQQETLRYTAQIAAEQASADEVARQAAAAAAAAAAAVVAPAVAAATTAQNTYIDWSAEFRGSGAATGGWRGAGPVLVGELGQEVVDFETPGRVYTNEQTRGMFASNAALEPLLRDIKAELRGLRDETRVGDVAAVTNLQKIEARLKKFDIDGMPAVRA
ncbi:phage tail length tape measure family protein [Ramlibacter monticola]